MDEPKVWFREWLKRHQGLNPHKEWRRYQAPGFAVVYRGWVRAFRMRGIREEDATAASEAMQAEPTLYPEKHLARVVKLAGRIKEQRAIDRSADETRRRIETGRSEERRQAKIKLLWDEVPEEFREPYRLWARNNFPELARFPQFVEFLSRNRWADLSTARIPEAIGA